MNIYVIENHIKYFSEEKMIELNINEFNKVIPIFEGIDNNRAILFSVIEGNNPGRIFVDEINTPKCALIYTLSNFFYLGGDEKDTHFIEEAKIHIIDVLKNGFDKSAVVFSFSDEWRNQLDIALADQGAIRIIRKMFDFDSDAFTAQNNLQDRFESGFILKPIDEAMAQECDVNVDWGSVTNFIDKSFGFSLLYENQIVSECHVGYIGSGLVELGVYTVENYRGKGYASVTTCAVIEKCMSLGHNRLVMG
jgi:hypothetical protein